MLSPDYVCRPVANPKARAFSSNSADQPLDEAGERPRLRFRRRPGGTSGCGPPDSGGAGILAAHRLERGLSSLSWAQRATRMSQNRSVSMAIPWTLPVSGSNQDRSRSSWPVVVAC